MKPGTPYASRELEMKPRCSKCMQGAANAARKPKVTQLCCKTRWCKGAGFRVISFYYVEEE